MLVSITTLQNDGTEGGVFIENSTGESDGSTDA